MWLGGGRRPTRLHAWSSGDQHYWVVGLPRGTALYDQALSGTSGTQYSQLVPSADARYVAVMVAQPEPSGPSAVTAAIRDAATRTVLARMIARHVTLVGTGY